MARLQANGIAINCDQHGAGEPLVVITGYGASSVVWRPEFIAGLARSFRVITFDNRGTGLSDMPEDPMSIAQLADDVAGVLDALGLDRAHVLGHSMGGMIAQEFALRHPQRLFGLILGATECGAPVSIPAAAETMALLSPAALAGLEPREAARRSWAAFYPPEFIASNRDLLEAIYDRTLANPTPLITRQRQLEARSACTTHDRLHLITAPTLVLTGDRDLIIPPGNAGLIHERIAGSRLQIIAGAAHIFPTSHPAETVAMVTEFLASIRVAA